MDNAYLFPSIIIFLQKTYMNIPSNVIILFFLMTVLSSCQQNVYAEKKWFMSAYFGQSSDNRFLDIVSKFDLQPINSRMAAFTLGKELMTYNDTIRFEAEGQITKYWGVQSHAELNGVLILRWLPFFWDDYLDTSFGIGDGLSYASDIPVLETDECEETSRLLNYLMVEFSFEIPKKASWDLFIRVHHRSGIFGLFNGVTEGSNLLGAGVRYKF
jgi:hypothetical protein